MLVVCAQWLKWPATINVVTGCVVSCVFIALYRMQSAAAVFACGGL